MLKLRPYQRDARKAVRAAFKEGKRRVIVAHATGTGKTVLFCRIVKKREGRALILAHRAELIDQAAQKIKDVGLSCGIVKAAQKDLGADIVVASVQTLVNCLPGLLQHGPFNTVVVDEAHHALAATYQTILQAVSTPSTLVLGVTATPYRGIASEGLGDVFESIVHSYDIETAIADGYLAPIVAKQVKLAGADFSKLKTAHGDITEASASKVLRDCHAPHQIARAVKELAMPRPTLIFAPTIDVAEEIEAECGKRGVKIASVFGHTPEDKRRATLQAFSNGQLQALVNCGVLTEGYDEPRVACVAMARPTKSPVLFTQIVGRGTRLHPEKSDLLVLDFVGATHRHDLMSVAKLLPKSQIGTPIAPPPKISGLPPGLKRAGESPFDWLNGAAPTIETQVVDLFKGRPFAWIKTNFGYVLDAGRETGIVALRKTGSGNWIVSVFFKGGQTPLWSGASFSYAQAHAEQYIKDSGAAPLARRDASWRKGAMSAGQASALTAWKVPHTSAWNRGQASDALTRAIAEANFKKAG